MVGRRQRPREGQQLQRRVVWIAILTLCLAATAIGSAQLVLGARGPRSLPPGKAAALRREQAAQEAALASPVPSILPAPTLEPQPSPPTGILDDFSTPWSPDIFKVQNVWQGYDEQGSFVQVYAGAPGDTPEAGELGIITTTSDGDTSETNYPTPQQDGTVSVTSYDGLVLTITAMDGTRFTFDVSTRQYG